MSALRSVFRLRRTAVEIFKFGKSFRNYGRLATGHHFGVCQSVLLQHRLVSRKANRYDDNSDSGSDSDDENQHKVRGESEFWRKKMTTLHRLLDVNKDGVVSFDDFKLLTDKFSDLGHLSSKHHDEFQELIQEAWEAQHVALDKYNFVTQEQFLEEMHHAVNDGDLSKKIHQFFPYFFKAVDKDRSGTITVDEFKLIFQCLGLDEQTAVKSFEAIDRNKDGKLSLDEFVKLGREYLVTEDESKPSKYFWGPLADH